jgi:hypothetical protein
MPLTTQQNLVLEQSRRLYDGVDRTGEHLDGKASAVLQAGSLIIALTSATTLPSLVSSQPSPPVLAGLAVGFLAFIGMTVCAILAWRPQEHKQVGATTWDDLFDMYISKEMDDAYNQVLYDLSCAITANMAANERKARYVALATWLLVLQVVGILVLALASGL